jgi:sigma-B regulation protein RsbU (phosphoserine phosphatase)
VANGQITAVAATGLPIGLTGERRYEVERLQLAEHDTLVLYTDGVTEARGPGGGMYGQERIERLLARRPVPATSRQVVQAIRDDLRGFADGAGGPDDLTLLALRRTGRADIAAA